MACNCNKAATVSAATYVYVAPDGTKRVYKSEIEAKAAVARNGGKYSKQ